MEETEATEKVVTVMNYWMFDYRNTYDHGGWEKAAGYGITSENRLIVDWVMEHPREAVAIQYSMNDHGSIFEITDRIFPWYEDIINGKVEEDIKQEDTKQEDIKNEDTNNEDINQEGK